MYAPAIQKRLTNKQNDHIRSLMLKQNLSFDDFKSIAQYSSEQIELFFEGNQDLFPEKTVLYNVIHEFLATRAKNLSIDYQVFKYLSNSRYFFPTHVIRRFFELKKLHKQGDDISTILYIIKENIYDYYGILFRKNSAYYNICKIITETIISTGFSPEIIQFNLRFRPPDNGFIFWTIDKTRCSVQVGNIVHPDYKFLFKGIDFKENFELKAPLDQIVGLRYFKKDFQFHFDEYLSTKNFVFQVVDQISNAKNPEIISQIFYFLEYICDATEYHKYTNVYSALSLLFHTNNNKNVIPLLEQIDKNVYYKLLIFFDEKTNLSANITNYISFIKENRSVTVDFTYDNEADNYDYLVDIAKVSSINYLIEQYKNKEMDSVLTIFALFPELIKYGEYFIDFREEMIQALEKIRDTTNNLKIPDKSLEEISNEIKNMKFVSKQFLNCFNFLWNVLPHDYVLKLPNKDISDGLSLSTIYSRVNDINNNKIINKFFDMMKGLPEISEAARSLLFKKIALTNSYDSITFLMQNFKKLTKKAKIKKDVFEQFLIDCCDKLLQGSCNSVKLYSNYEKSFDPKKIKQAKIMEEIKKPKETIGKALLINLFDRKAAGESYQKYQLNLVITYFSKLRYWFEKIPLFFESEDEDELKYNKANKKELFEMIIDADQRGQFDESMTKEFTIFYSDSPELVVYDNKDFTKKEYRSLFHIFIFEDGGKQPRYSTAPPGNLISVKFPICYKPIKCSFSDLKSTFDKAVKVCNQDIEVFYKDMFLEVVDEKKEEIPIDKILKEIETNTNNQEKEEKPNDVYNKQKINDLVAKEEFSNQTKTEIIKKDELSNQQKPEIIKKDELSNQQKPEIIKKEELSNQTKTEIIKKDELYNQQKPEIIKKDELSKQQSLHDSTQQNIGSIQQEKAEEQKQSIPTEKKPVLIPFQPIKNQVESDKLKYKGVDYLYVKRIGDKFISNFSKIEINARDVNDIQYTPFEIYIRYFSCFNEIPYIQNSPELNNCIRYSYNNCLITFYVYFNNFIKGDFEYKGNIMINNFIFPFDFKFNVIDTICYVSIPGLQFSIDQQTQRPFTSFNSIEKPFKINSFDSKFNELKNQIEIYGNASLNENSELEIKEKSSFGVVVYLSKQNSMYTGINFYPSDSTDSLEMFYFHPGLRQFCKTDKIFAGFYATYCNFYIKGYDESKYQITFNPSNKIFFNQHSYKNNILTFSYAFKTTSRKQVFIEIVFTSEKETKTFRFEVINTQLEIIENNNEICCRFEYEELNTIPCLYYDIDDNIFKPIKPNEFIQKPKYKFIVLSCFNYNFISYDEPNCQTHVKFKYENIYPPNVTNFCFLVLENNDKIRIIKKDEFNPRTMRKICARLCDFDFDPNNDDNMKWRFTWIPISQDVTYINEILSDYKNLDDFCSIFFKFIREEKPKEDLKNTVIKYFQDRVNMIISMRGFLRFPMNGKKLKEAAFSISGVTKFSPVECMMFEKSFKENDVIMFTKNNITIVNSKNIDMKSVESFSFDFGDFATNDYLVINENRTLDIDYALYLCSFLPLLIKKQLISEDYAIKLYSELEKYHLSSNNDTNEIIKEFNKSFQMIKNMITKNNDITSINPSNVIKNSIPSFELSNQQVINQVSTNYQQNIQQFVGYNQNQQNTQQFVGYNQIQNQQNTQQFVSYIQTVNQQVNAQQFVGYNQPQSYQNNQQTENTQPFANFMNDNPYLL
ncbi:hypothetical protein TVAG_454500 [Trichomonas vaginalis G3]|uniref:Uncharacterized protein n=1 Tax=Trichomonas vaginalis (strain ATCC PRA-98 / G3) TaxID=412133 RepID=A2EU63_TRIV3|nr:hypothetical protein TVAGG3_0231510 [Trichomonas vaginalis G3]EAY03811.1 hypothetical protein TVAG_454500 [Trichomonas vaginalis G3]KAI5552667.1 hypothetical protein TVAGG3_0231510 [Trichomonas vaginalis G3]|eukprot:XP_001316034.1 hypothetical protein [Trichomonas vaginalis G3]